MTCHLLESWKHFHDWFLDSIEIGPNNEPRTLTLGLYLGDKRVALTFEGVTCVSFEQLGLLNIVYAIRIVQPSDVEYARAMAMLERGERLGLRKAALLVCVYSTLGVEVTIECDAFVVQERQAD